MVYDQPAPMNGERRGYDFSGKEQSDAFRTLGTVWAAHLSSSELHLVTWLMSNTVSRGRRSGVYSLPQLVQGVRRKDGGWWTRGTGMSESTLRRVIKSLRLKGVVHTCQEDMGTRFTVVLGWCPPGQEESKVVPLNLPRRSRPQRSTSVTEEASALDGEWGGGQFEHRGVVNLAGGAGQGEHPSKETPTNQQPLETSSDTTAARPVMASTPEEKSQSFGTVAVGRKPIRVISPALKEPSPDCAAPPPNVVPFDPSRSVKDAIQRAEHARAERLDRARRKTDMGALFVTWEAAWAERYPASPCPGWTKKDAGILRKAIEARWPSRQRPELHDFFVFTVEHWSVLMRTKFQWMSKNPPPDMPSHSFIARFMTHFQDAWADRQDIIFIGTQPGLKQAALRRAKERGVTVETALAAVIAEDHALRTEQKVEALAVQAKRNMEMAIVAENNARRATRFTADNPHPRAHENKRRTDGIPNVTAKEVDWAHGIDANIKFNFGDE